MFKFDEELKDEFSFIEWRQIVGIRNRIAHDYRGIDPEMVFQIIVNEIDILKDVMKKMLAIAAIDQKSLKQLINDQFYPHLGYLLTHS